MRWNKVFVDKVEAVPIANIDFYSTEAKSVLSPRASEFSFAASTPEEEHDFLNGLAKCGEKVVGLCAFHEFAAPFICNDPPPKPSLPRPLRDLHRPNMGEQDKQMYINEVLRNMSLTDEQVYLIEEQTRSQSSSVAWHQQRAGRITASYAHEVHHCMLYNPP